ncbi:hypothetical protein ACFL23_02995 [Patescibacteria group bacterium]
MQNEMQANIIGNIFSEALEFEGVDKNLLMKNATELQAHIISKVRELSGHDLYDNEYIESKWGYASGYKNPIGIPEQIDILRSHENWPNLNPDSAIKYWREVCPNLQIPDWVDGPFVEIRDGCFSNNYGEELEEVFKAFAKSRNGKFENNLAGKYDRLRQTKWSLLCRDELYRQQPKGDIVISFRQLGIRQPINKGKHVVSSVRRAINKFVSREYGLGSKNGFTGLLTNQNRLACFGDLGMDFPGDEFDFGDGRFFGAPCVYYYSDRVIFRAYLIYIADSNYGAVSAFLPQ